VQLVFDWHKLLVCIHRAMMLNTQGLVVASKEIGLEINIEENKYMVLSWDNVQDKITT
jgi:hypothetical protein